jgi:hypothetical protein
VNYSAIANALYSIADFKEQNLDGWEQLSLFGAAPEQDASAEASGA